jgi:hypothetical protein
MLIMKRNLLACGLVAGPLFIAASLTQAFTRKGFDLARHPISLLSLGAPGWVQIANFVVCGILYLLGAVGRGKHYAKVAAVPGALCLLESPVSG